MVTPLDDMPGLRSQHHRHRHPPRPRLMQKDKRFDQFAGHPGRNRSRVSNRDPFFHNVFSLFEKAL